MRRWLVLLAVATLVVAAGCEAVGEPQASPGPAGPGQPLASSTTPTAAAEETPTEEPTAAPTAGPKLAANDTLHYTSATSPGRLIELKVTVRNRGSKAGGKITMEVEGLTFVLKRKTPLVGCIPNCKAGTAADGVAHIVWTAPKAGESKAYTAQLRAKVKGTYKYEVRVYEGSPGSYGDELGSWTVTSRVR